VREDLCNNSITDEETMDRLLKSITEQRWSVPSSHPWKSDYLLAIDTIGWVFEQPSRVRFGQLNAEASGHLLGGSDAPAGRIGTFEENDNALKSIAASSEKRASFMPFERPALQPVVDQHLMLIELLSVNSERTIRSIDQLRIDRIGTLTMLELERFSLREKRYPATLDELFAGRLGELPMDPYSGKPLCYKRLDPKADPQGRSYLLYSVGGDGRDDGGNGGNLYASPPDALGAKRVDSITTTRPGSTLDYIINRPRR
jgi:hypothetical protein